MDASKGKPYRAQSVGLFRILSEQADHTCYTIAEHKRIYSVVGLVRSFVIELRMLLFLVRERVSAMVSYDDHPNTTELRLRKRRNRRSAPIDYIAHEERRHERTNLSQWLCEPVRDNKIKPLRLR